MMSDNINNRLDDISVKVTSGSYKFALRELRKLCRIHANNTSLLLNKPAILAEIGLGLRNTRVIKEAISLGELNLSNHILSDYRGSIYYNLANSYYSLFLLEKNKRKTPLSDRIQKSKHYLRKSLLMKSPTILTKQLLVNYGNCLDSLGRSIEAIDVYDQALQIDNNFSMAIANRAKALRTFAEISDKYRMATYVEVYQDIQSALDNPDLVANGGQIAKQAFEHELRYIESRFQDKSLLKKKLKHPKYKINSLSNFEKFYLDLCQKEKLFLNFHIHQDHCSAAIEDPIFISLITKVDDNDTFYKLAKYLNQIKEDYAVARLLLVQSQYRQEDFNRISERTSFVYTLDYSQFNIYTGLLKSSFKDAFNILDKVAVFINEYYQLGYREEDIYFDSIRGKGRSLSIWQDAGIIRKEILNSENISLYALYDISRDFQCGEHQRIQDIRNALIHRRLVIYDSGITDWDSKLDKHNIGYNTMLAETIQLMKLVKAAIIYLVNFVNVEESKKRKASGKLILDMYADTSQFL